MHAMASAGVVIAVARACQNGEVDKCGDCESGNVSAGASYQWGSCSNEIWVSIKRDVISEYWVFACVG